MKKLLLVLSGPTAVGKTGFAIEIAKSLGTSIVSADSRQVYKEMKIGTAVPNAEELAAAKHFFIHSHSIHSPLSAGAYEREALSLLEEQFKEKDVVVCSGGTGLYIQALCRGMDKFPLVPERIIKDVEQIFKDYGLAGLQKRLEKLDPVYFEQVDKSNHQRIMRALSVCLASNKSYSSFRTGKTAERFFDVIYVCLDRKRDLLYERINKRVESMLVEGLLAEVKQLYPYKDLSVLQTVGYSELFSFLDGDIDFDTAVELIKRNTRRYAKRQLTWWRNRPFDVSVIKPNASGISEVLALVQRKIIID